MNKYEGLKRSALKSCKFRGHKMERFNFSVNSIGDIRASAVCKNCGKKVFVCTNPQPNEIDIGGEAVALNCERD